MEGPKFSRVRGRLNCQKTICLTAKQILAYFFLYVICILEVYVIKKKKKKIIFNLEKFMYYYGLFCTFKFIFFFKFAIKLNEIEVCVIVITPTLACLTKSGKLIKFISFFSDEVSNDVIASKS